MGKDDTWNLEHIKNISAFNHSLTFALTWTGHSADFLVEHSREATLSDRKPWFLVRMPEDANRPGAQWVRSEAASHGRIEARPIALEGWIALLAFIAVAAATPLTIWLGMVLPGHMSAAMALVWTVMVEAILVAAFVLLVQSRMDAPAHQTKPVTDGWDQTFQILW